MKKNAKKSSVISLIETQVRRVSLEFAPYDSPFCYVVKEYSKKGKFFVLTMYFNHLEDAENYMFENFIYMIIPTNRLIHEGSHIFLY